MAQCIERMPPSGRNAEKRGEIREKHGDTRRNTEKYGRNTMDEKDMQRYDDIIELAHPTSKKHPRMSLHDRAAQFAPFSALPRYKDALAEAADAAQRKNDK